MSLSSSSSSNSSLASTGGCKEVGIKNTGRKKRKFCEMTTLTEDEIKFTKLAHWTMAHHLDVPLAQASEETLMNLRQMIGITAKLCGLNPTSCAVEKEILTDLLDKQLRMLRRFFGILEDKEYMFYPDEKTFRKNKKEVSRSGVKDDWEFSFVFDNFEYFRTQFPQVVAMSTAPAGKGKGSSSREPPTPFGIFLKLANKYLSMDYDAYAAAVIAFSKFKSRFEAISHKERKKWVKSFVGQKPAQPSCSRSTGSVSKKRLREIIWM